MKSCYKYLKKQDAAKVLIGNSRTCNVIVDLLLLIAKQYIYTCRVAQYIPNQPGVIKCIKSYRNIEEKIAMKNGKLEHFLEKWRGCNP